MDILMDPDYTLQISMPAVTRPFGRESPPSQVRRVLTAEKTDAPFPAAVVGKKAISRIHA